jgi:low affinity Fe/Cu permease
MNNAYRDIDRKFEKLTRYATKMLGNSIVFIIAFCMVIFWWATNLFASKNIHQNIGDIIFGFTFLSLFIIQKSFNRYSAAIHLKINELISSHKSAHNSVMNTYQKTEFEIREMSKEYTKGADSQDKKLDNIIKEINTDNQI